jgi:phosphoglycerate dehydrogenase-like enzyme
MYRSASQHPVVAIYHAEPDAYLERIARVVAPEQLRVCRDPCALEAIAADADVALCFKFAGHVFPRETVLRLRRIKWVQLASAGADHIHPFDPRQVIVTSAVGIHGTVMAEYVMGTLVHMLWDFQRLMRQQRERLWQNYPVQSLAGRSMGIIGAGHVGGEIGRRARAFGMRVIGMRRSAEPVRDFDEVRGPDALHSLLADSDVIVVSVPLTSATRGLIGRDALACVRPGAWFVNVSRGGVVDEDALADALESGRLAGAVLDVFEREPLPPQSRFWGMRQVFVTPHISSEFAGWQSAVADLFLENLGRWTSGQPLRNVVSPALGY